jgi:hypothetical protein
MITTKRPCTPKESLKNSLIEMKKMRENQKPKTTWNQFRNELNKNDSKKKHK